MERSEPFVSPSQVLILRMRVMDGYGRRTVLDRTFVKKRSQSLISFFFLNPRVLIPPTKFFEKLYNITKKALILRLKLLRKGRDSNPRYSHPVYRLSRSAHSTTLTPFQRRLQIYNIYNVKLIFRFFKSTKNIQVLLT